MGQHPRRAGNAILALVVVSVALLSLAIAGYPGGTSFDRGARGHDVWRNFVCDLTAPVALNGVANPQGAALASLALLGLGVALALFWWHLSALAVPSVRTRRVVRVAGLVSSLALIALPFTRWPLLLWFHPLIVSLSAIPGLLAGAMLLYGLRRARPNWWALWAVGVGTFVLASADSVLYAIHLYTRSPVILALPALQRLATLGFLAFVCHGALRIRNLHSIEGLR